MFGNPLRVMEGSSLRITIWEGSFHHQRGLSWQVPLNPIFFQNLYLLLMFCLFGILSLYRAQIRASLSQVALIHRGGNNVFPTSIRLDEVTCQLPALLVGDCILRTSIQNCIRLALDTQSMTKSFTKADNFIYSCSLRLN